MTKPRWPDDEPPPRPPARKKSLLARIGDALAGGIHTAGTGSAMGAKVRGVDRNVLVDHRVMTEVRRNQAKDE
ncbi:MAG TPA: hypothetical protein VEX62_11585 [Candidatus Limnocylindrales bacterium]|jgi:hypothetical protein|nr:hypothetical protein [Candidatus Limnocylindrales bacterium]